ncbi:MAG: hypothetical protein A3C61_01950 [Candidatus Yanofskybacteria bacterium RIFCSPHIGHO2_02_FULL_39_10]|uniref:Gfo/Idh/MocA-like oxidoreductase N-terminal domain-containing protein n=1 Tax=Candidatus Yanofskybacteria bacterium RIFCSPHIGHO2_02_FULL_39_10 TaxID=1802674 RepID=A0A1F8F5W2_9BACT|nr:MAG: hypothetical protein A3C61_01950 [Candidatus Yanofskybacteria bacterium RIFCSPHIGHO2_02_FULL_39_10]
MKKPIRLGFIGCGGHSARHADVVSKIYESYEIVAAMDTQLGSAIKFLSKYKGLNGVASSNLDKFFEANMEAVLIGSPHKYHLEQAEAAVRAGKHVLCEKPLWEARTPAEVDQKLQTARRIIEEAAARGLIFSSCHLRRYEKEYVYIKEHLDEYLEKFGGVVEAHFQFFYHEPSTGWKMDDSLLLDHMNHEIDLIHFLFGYSPATFWRLSHSFDEYRVAGKTESGLGIWFSGYRRLKSRTFRNELELIFERGRVRTEVVLNSGSGMVSSSVSTLSFEDDSETVTHFCAHSYDDALVGVMRNFAAAIRGEEKCYLTTHDLLVNTTICNDLILNEHGEI